MAYPNNLAQILILMGYEHETNFEVRDDLDGNGPYFDSWAHADPQPTENDVNTFWSSHQSHPQRLVEYKTIAKYSVDSAAERARLRYITNGAGQALVYQKKEEEARAYVTAGYPADTSTYPFVEAEINATGKTKEAAADDIVAQADAWITTGASIEEQRLAGKKAVDDAVDTAGVDTAKDAAVALLDAI